MMFYKEEYQGFILNKKNRLCRPNKTNGSDDNEIIQNLEFNRRKILTTLSKNFPVSRLTIRHICKKQGFFTEKHRKIF